MNGQAPFEAIEDRPIPLRTRQDLIYQKIGFQGRGYWVVKDPIGLRYHRLQDEHYLVLQRLSAECTLSELKDQVQRRFSSLPVQVSHIQHLIGDLSEKGLVVGTRPGQGDVLLRAGRKRQRKETLNTLRSFLFLRLPGWYPEPLLSWMLPWTRWLFRPWCVVVSMLFVLFALLWVTVQIDEFQQRLPEFQQFFGWPNLISLWLTLAVTKILHEFGHGISCKHLGADCHKIGIMLLVFSPTLYCDVTDSWMMKNKWHRMAIGLAGVYIEAILSSLAVFGWWFSEPGLFHYLCLNVIFVSTVTTVIFNLNPLMRFDGYYVLSDYLEIPNLSAKANRAITNTLFRYCCGIRMPRDPFQPDRDTFWFATYAVAAWAYRIFIFTGIAFFLYTVLKPYGLQNLGIALAITSLGTMLWGMLRTAWKVLNRPRIEPMSRPKLAMTAIVLVLLTGAATAVPFPLWMNASFVVQPQQGRQTFVKTPGKLKKVHVQPGSEVVKGQLLAELENTELEEQLIEVRKEIALAEIRRKVAQALNDPDERELADKRISTLSDRLRNLEDEFAELRIIAPISGIVVAPPAKAEQPRGNEAARLEDWNGTPLAARNIDMELPSGTELMTIAPGEGSEAVAYIEQDYRHDVHVGQRVLLRCYHLPGKILESQVREISKEFSLSIDPSLSNKRQGEMPTEVDEQGREQLLDAASQALVPLPVAEELLRPGMRGRARFMLESRTLASWLWRAGRRTFHFRL